jgi:hypothetical protein
MAKRVISGIYLWQANPKTAGNPAWEIDQNYPEIPG